MWLGNAVTSSTLHADPPSNETIAVFYIKTTTRQADAVNGKCHHKNYTYMQQQNKKVPRIESKEE